MMYYPEQKYKYSMFNLTDGKFAVRQEKLHEVRSKITCSESLVIIGQLKFVNYVILLFLVDPGHMTSENHQKF